MARILVTGGAGFIGSHLCERLLAEGNDVICIDNFITGSPDNIAPFLGNQRFRFIQQDVTNFIYVPGPVDASCTSRRRRARSTTSSCRSRR